MVDEANVALIAEISIIRKTLLQNILFWVETMQKSDQYILLTNCTISRIDTLLHSS